MYGLCSSSSRQDFHARMSSSHTQALRLFGKTPQLVLLHQEKGLQPETFRGGFWGSPRGRVTHPSAGGGADVQTDSSQTKKLQPLLPLCRARFDFLPGATSAGWMCKASSTVSPTRLMRLSASGRPLYINGKCSREDNRHMGGCDERWHPARD